MCNPRRIARLPLTIGQARPLVTRYIASTAALTIAAAAQLATFAILARAFGPRQFGLYIQFTAVASIAVQLCGLGASDSLIRRVSREPTAYPDLLGHNLIMVLASGALLVVVGTPLTHWRFSLDRGMAVDMVAACLLLISNVVLTRLVLLVETIFLSLGKTVDGNRAVVGFAVARTIIAATACYVLGTTTIAKWATIQFCGFSFYAAFCCWWLHRLGVPRWHVMRDEIRPGILYASQFVARAVRQNIDFLALGAILPATTIGSYGIARRISDASFLSIEAMNRLLYPRLARVGRQGFAAIFFEARYALVAALLIGTTTAAGLVLLAPLLPGIVGAAYAEAAVYLRILSGLIVLVAAWSIAIDVLGASNRHGARAIVMNSVNIVGSGVVVAATMLAALPGAFISFYVVEASTLFISWAVLWMIARRTGQSDILATPTAASSDDTLVD